MIYKNSQTSIEFVILVGAVLFLFSAFFIAIQINMSDTIKLKKDIAIKEIALIVKNEIDLASQSSDGYYREFEIPKDINGDDYSIIMVENMVYIKTDNKKHAIMMPVQNATGQIIKNKNIIKKLNGIVKLNI